MNVIILEFLSLVLVVSIAGTPVQHPGRQARSPGSCATQLNTLHEVLLQFQWKPPSELTAMSEDDKRNTLIVEIFQHSTLNIPQLQGKPNAGTRHGSLVDIGSMIGTLKQYGWKTQTQLENMSYDDIRNTLIVELNQRKGLTIPDLQSKSDSELVQIACPPPPAPASAKCGQVKIGGKHRIVGGTEARVGAWPWAVILGTPLADGSFDVICGGTLLDQETVLTAAHCPDQAVASHVRLGEHDITTTLDGASHTDVRVSRKLDHPGWNSDTLDNDIALLKLAQPVGYSQHIQPACLPDDYQDLDLAAELTSPEPTVIGWGLTEEWERTSRYLNQVNVPVVPNDECRRAYSNIDSTKMCAGRGGKDACQGDSGGALLSNKQGGAWAVLGITSFGSGCAREGFPGAYTRVDKYLGWIKQNMNIK